MKLIIGTKVLIVVRLGEFVVDFGVEQNGCFIRPAPGHVADRVSSSSNNQRWDVELFHKRNAFCRVSLCQ